MKQNRLKSLKICQSIRYKRLLEASGFSKRYEIFFGHTETLSYKLNDFIGSRFVFSLHCIVT